MIIRRLKPHHGLLLILLVALAWRTAFWFGIRDTPLAHWHTWDQSDMHSYWTQAERLAAGDWLAREPYYPYHAWMQAAAAEKWREWYPPGVFYQAPLLIYGLAALMRLGLDAAFWMRLGLLVLGVIHCGLVYRVASHLGGRVVGTVAGLIMAVYGPLLMIESQLLREGAALTLVLLALLGLASLETRDGTDAKPIVGRAVGIGAIIGVLALLHEAAAIVLAVCLLAGGMRLIVAGGPPRSGPRRAVVWAGMLVIGVLVGFSPLLARNVAVGAPPLAQSTRSRLTWAMANHAAAPNGGVTWSAPGPQFVETMDRAGVGSLGLIAEVLGSYHGQWRVWLGRWGRRLGGLLVGPEARDNTSYAFFRLHVPLLALCLDFRWLMPLGLAGMVLHGRRWRGATRRGAMAFSLLIYLILMMAALSIVFPLGRYRLFLLPVLIPFAARGLVAAWLAVRGGRAKRVAVYLGLVGSLIACQWGLGHAYPGLGGLRAEDFVTASRMLAGWGRPDLAAGELELGLAHGADSRQLRIELALAHGRALRERGDHGAAVVVLEELMEFAPDSTAGIAALAWLRAAGNGPRVRDGRQAMRLSARLLATSESDPVLGLDILSAACAELGDYEAAVAAASEALELARREGREALALEIEKRLALYRKHRPFRLGRGE